jgi:flagellar biosynthesis/type III secretory pathway protein FliH
LRKIIKRSNTEQINTFRLHYFPNIPAPDEGNGGAQGKFSASESGVSRPEAAKRPAVVAEAPGIDTEAIERAAYEKGYAQGEHEGRLAADAQAAPLRSALENTLAELDGIRERIRQQVEHEVVELALHIARKVVHHELSVSKDAIVGVVKDALGQLEDPGKIAIRLNPEDLKRIQSAGDRLKSVLDHLESVQFEEDAGIDCGGCYIQTEFGEVDARIDEQLRAVEEAIRSEMRITPHEQ